MPFFLKECSPLFIPDGAKWPRTLIVLTLATLVPGKLLQQPFVFNIVTSFINLKVYFHQHEEEGLS
jgi:hypothetical protein